MHKDDAFDPEHLNIAFHRLQPEMLLQSIRGWYAVTPLPASDRVSSQDWGNFAYHHYTTAYSGTHRTDDEARYLDAHFKQRMGDEDGSQSVFTLLRRYSEGLLTTDGTQPVCRYERVLRWRQLSLMLSQDLFTTAYAASEDMQHGCRRKHFIWPAVIGTDNKRLSQIAAHGMAENHFHLTGSTRMFTLSWICMMNHPDQINTFFADRDVRQNFRDRLNQALSMGPNVNPMSWQELLMYAAYLRAKIFERVMITPEAVSGSHHPDAWLEDFRRFDREPVHRMRDTKHFVERLRYEPNAVRLPQKDGRPLVLDYALTDALIGCYDSHNRLLAGERQLLYMLFRKSFDRSLTDQEQDCFYLYLLIQNQFRSEIIQVNGRVGFQNFARYQDRKELFWGNCPGYWDESVRLGVNAALEKGYIRALEARICPANTLARQYIKIREIDESYGFAETGVCPQKRQLDIIADSPLFYVLHFPKDTKEIPDSFRNSSRDICSMVYPRNSSARRRTEMQARQIAKALSRSPYLRKRIRGIDACSNEIGCRPETFATDFRFLRSGIPCSNRHNFLPETENKVYLHATYHAGEDFIDIIDGLRAIDEAVQFLELRRGDRLGHALALGLDPKSYYTLKEYKLIIPKQELLDNLVWILHRPLEYDLALPPKLRKRLERKALELMDEIGYDTSAYTLLTYYHAWQLRGDHPSVYLSGGEDSSHIRDSGYESFYCMNRPSLDIYRNNRNVHTLCNLYHYDGDIKKRGKQVEAYPIEHGMEELIEALQNRMQHQLMEKGIAIECNPSSNVLIGSIEQYREHPMFRFNHHGLRVPRWETEAPANLSVSVNTDDQGVFDTSLESEYAYVARCLECERDEEGHRINSNDEIYAYLDHIRVLGNSQSFHRLGEEIFFSNAKEYRRFCNRLCEDAHRSEENGEMI